MENKINLIIKNDKSPKFYKEYSKLFYNYFPNIEKKLVDKISLAGYLYYHSILYLDSILDDYTTPHS